MVEMDPSQRRPTGAGNQLLRRCSRSARISIGPGLRESAGWCRIRRALACGHSHPRCRPSRAIEASWLACCRLSQRGFGRPSECCPRRECCACYGPAGATCPEERVVTAHFDSPGRSPVTTWPFAARPWRGFRGRARRPWDRSPDPCRCPCRRSCLGLGRSRGRRSAGTCVRSARR
jgi:hypothetical protein